MRILIERNNNNIIHYVHEVDDNLVKTRCGQLIKLHIDFNQLIVFKDKRNLKEKNNAIIVNCEKCKAEFKKLFSENASKSDYTKGNKRIRNYHKPKVAKLVNRNKYKITKE